MLIGHIYFFGELFISFVYFSNGGVVINLLDLLCYYSFLYFCKYLYFP